MKHTFTFFLFLVFINFLNGQSFSINNPTQTYTLDIVSPAQLPAWMGMGTEINNNTNQNLNLAWEQLNQSIPADWQTNPCFFYFVGNGYDCSIPAGSSVISANNVDYTDVSLELFSLDTSGVATIEYLVYDTADSLNSHQIMTFNFEVNVPDIGDDPFSIIPDSSHMTFTVDEPWDLPVFVYHDVQIFNHSFNDLNLQWELLDESVPSDWMVGGCFFNGWECSMEDQTVYLYGGEMQYMNFSMEIQSLDTTGVATHRFLVYDPLDSLETHKIVTFVSEIEVTGDFNLGFQVYQDSSYQFVEIFEPDQPAFAFHFFDIENPFFNELEIGWKITSETFPEEWGDITKELYVAGMFYSDPIPQEGSFLMPPGFVEFFEINILDIETNGIPGRHEMEIHIWNLNDSLDNNETLKAVTQVCPAIVDENIILAPDVSAYCNQEPITISGADGFDYYWWSTGETSQTVNLLGGIGIVSLRAWNEGDCIRYDEIDLQLLTPYQEEICLVTVDPESGGNVVVWEKTDDQKTVWYNIYKETNEAGVYDLIGSQLYDSLSIFIDENSNPLAGSSRYKISTLDSCGNESFLSQEHKTMHLTSSVGINNEVNLIWDNYEGFQYATFNIYRGPSPDAMTLLQQRPSNTFTFTDLTPPDGDLYYVIEVEFPDGCNPTRSPINPYASSTSNLVTTSIVSTAEAFDGYNIKMYPNPASNEVMLSIPVELNIELIEILDYSGRLLQTHAAQSGLFELDTQDLSNGLYMIRLTGEHTFRDKLLIEHN